MQFNKSVTLLLIKILLLIQTFEAHLKLFLTLEFKFPDFIVTLQPHFSTSKELLEHITFFIQSSCNLAVLSLQNCAWKHDSMMGTLTLPRKSCRQWPRTEKSLLRRLPPLRTSPKMLTHFFPMRFHISRQM